MYGYTVTAYYTCTVDSRTDPKSGTVFFSFRFHASTHHCRYYCLFLAVNYKNTLPSSPSSFSLSVFSIILVHRPRPTSSGHQRPQYRYLVPTTNILSFYSSIFSREIFRIMAIRRIRAKASAKATSNTTDNTSAILRRAQPRALSPSQHGMRISNIRSATSKT